MWTEDSRRISLLEELRNDIKLLEAESVNLGNELDDLKDKYNRCIGALLSAANFIENGTGKIDEVMAAINECLEDE